MGNNIAIQPAELTDTFGRSIRYLRLSITDRCDLRCQYCMTDSMRFLSREHILSFEEIETLTRAFVELGVHKVRITGGEPLVRKGAVQLLENLNAIPGLTELVLTTNGTQLGQHAEGLFNAGIKRINISLDSLHIDSFKKITRGGELAKVLTGIETAQQYNFESIKINVVAMRGVNDDQIMPLLQYAYDNALDISYIEEMPLGVMDSYNRGMQFIASSEIREMIARHHTLLPTTETTGGPARYYYSPDYPQTRIGFISPHSQNFCASCNRVRVTAEGKLVLCLGEDNAIDLKAILRQYPGQTEPLKQCLLKVIQYKPEQHEFTLDNATQVMRFMNMTGG